MAHKPSPRKPAKPRAPKAAHPDPASGLDGPHERRSSRKSDDPARGTGDGQPNALTQHGDH